MIPFLLASSLAAQPAQRLDQSTLVDRLADEGMGELLDHLVATEPPQDPIVAAQVEIAAGQLRYRAAPDPADRAAGLDAALNALRKAIRSHRDHPQRPVWQTDLGELLLTDYLAGLHQQAAEFYEFGVPSRSQRAAFEDAVPEALAALTDAEQRLAQLQNLLPREPDYQARYLRTGVAQRLFDEYYRKRTRYYVAHAAHLGTLLPATPAEEKSRLRTLALDRAGTFANDPVDTAGVRLPSLTLVARVLLGQGHAQEAISRLQPVLEARAGDLFGLTAHLTAAQAQARLGHAAAAAERLRSLTRHPLVESNLLLRLLTTDALHRLRLAEADKAHDAARPAAVDAAYAPYGELLEDPSLDSQADALRNYIYLRWRDASDPTIDPRSLPPVVRAGLGEIARVEGQNLAVEAQEQNDPAKLSAARDRLRTAISLNETLLNAPSEAVRVRATFNLALSRYFLDPADLQGVLEAAGTFVELANRFPSRPEAVEGLGYALSLLRQLHALEPQPAGAAEGYESAARVLFDKFGSETIADDERLYYGASVLAASGRFHEAAGILAGVPRTHADFFAAQREMLFSLEDALRLATGDERERLRMDLARAAAAAAETARGAPGDAARRAAAAAELALVAAALDTGETGGTVEAGQLQRAMRLLEGFEDRYAGLDDMIRFALERRVTALAAARRLDRLGSEAKEMMAAYPDAAAYVIDRVLTNLDAEIASLRTQANVEESPARRRELLATAEDRAATASTLAEMLVNWAREQRYDPEQLLPYELALARSRLLAGQPAAALEITTTLARNFGDKADVLHQHAEALFAVGERDNLLLAAPLYDRLIAGLTGPPYPALWWNAWMRRLQINDRLDQGVADIALRVRQLKLTDPNLGGPPYQDALERLAEKHAR